MRDREAPSYRAPDWVDEVDSRPYRPEPHHQHLQPAERPIPGNPFPRKAGEGMQHASWNAGIAFAGVMLGIGAGLLIVPAIVIGILAAFLGGDILSENPSTRVPLVVAQLAGQAVMLAIVVGFAREDGDTLTSLGRRLGFVRPRWRDAGWLLAGYVAFFGFALLYGSLFEQPQQDDLIENLGGKSGTLGLILAALVIVGMAPVAEETLFRGFFHGGLRRSLPFWSAALMSGGLFGLVHIGGVEEFTLTAVLSVVPLLAVFGLILAWLYERTGSLWPPIAMHLINNAIAFSLGVWGTGAVLAPGLLA
ncbi:MAG: CPBP family intramembrane glutamic endopeptidase [Solirubrobacterales bacterium]